MLMSGWRRMKHATAAGSAQTAVFQNSVNPITASRITATVCTPTMAPRQPRRRFTSGTIKPAKSTSTLLMDP